jgi:hypothetical protein
MNRRWKVVTLALITAAALSVCPLMAQADIPEPESNTSKATFTNITTDVDNFFSVHDYGDVEFEKYFGYAGVVADSGLALHLGYAKRFGGIYLGAFYAGRIADNGKEDVITSTETEGSLTNGVFQQDSTEEKVTNNHTQNTPGGEFTSASNPPRFNNNLGVLIGIAGMGIKAGFYENLRGTDKPRTQVPTLIQIPLEGDVSTITEDADGTKTVFEYTDYHYLEGVMKPYLEWGMQLPLGGLTIKPKVGLGFDIYRDTTKYTMKGESGSPNVGSPTAHNPNETKTEGGTTTLIGTQVTRNYYNDSGYFAPDITVGADVDFAAKETSQFGVGVEYGVSFNVYNKSYDTADGSDKVAGTVTVNNYTRKTVNDTETRDSESSWVRAIERSKIAHTISPSFWYANDLSDRVSLGFGGGLDFSIGSESAHTKTTYTEIGTSTPHDGSYGSKWTYVETREGYIDTTTTANSRPATEEISTFGVESNLNAGVSWKAIPDRFTLNAGIKVTLPKYERTTTLTKDQNLTIEKTDWEREDGTKSSETNIVTPSGSGTISATETEQVDRTWARLNAAFAIGGNFIFTPNFGVDLYFTNSGGNLNSSNASTALNLTNPAFSMIFSLKF